MNALKIIMLTAMVSALVACGSAGEKQKNKADAKYTQEKTKTMQEYKSCVKKAKNDEDKVEVCERLLKAAEVD